VYEVEGNLALVCDAEGRRSGAFRWAERLGILGKRATQKRVPPEVFELAQDDVRLFLGRLWSGDGFIADARNNTPFYATSSEGLAVDVQALLLRLGIVSRLKSKMFKYRGGHKPGYTVHLIGENVRLAFLEQLGPHILGRDTAMKLLREQVAACAADRSSKDTVPMGVVARIDAQRTRLNWTKAELHRRAGVDAHAFHKVRVSAGLRRSTVARVASALGNLALQRLATSDVYWDRVVSIEPAGVENVYDLEIEGDHNFVADGLIVHKSHAAAYALLAYQTAYLKANHPAEFMAATLTSEMADSARIVTLIEECRRMKLEILPPDVNRSVWRFTLEDGKIRFGLGAVRNVGQASVETIVAARKEGGAFRDLFDLAMRIDARAMNRRVLESLVAAGACDGLGPERGAMHAGAEKVLQQAAALQREKTSGQSSLFSEEAGGGVAVVAPPLPEGPPWSAGDRSAKEKEVLGFYFSEHPLEPLREMLAKLVTHTIGDALTLEDGAEVRVGAVVMEVKKITTRAGKAMAAVMLEDLTGRIECTVFPEGWEASRALLEEDRIVVVSGRIEVREDRGTKLLLAEARSLEQARSEYRPCLHLEIRSVNLSVGWLEQVDETLSGFPGDSDVYLHIVMPDASRKASRSKRYRVAEDERVVAAIKQRFPFVRVAWGKGMA
jgi:DNA polymerase III subunit alpha